MALLEDNRERELMTVIRSAGEVLLKFWPGRKEKKGSAELHIEKKSDGSFVTEADFASNKIILEALARLFPDEGVYSEEVPAAANLASFRRAWIIDPLDGTQSFIDGNDDFSVLVARCDGAAPELGYMHFPARKLFAVARKGRGAEIDGRRLAVSQAAKPRSHSVYLRHLNLASDPMFYDRWMDSGMAFLSVCLGDFDGVILRIVNHREWDLAAPAVIIQESGGKVTDEHGRPVAFQRGPIEYKYFVASNGKVHDQLLALIPKG